MARTKVAAPPPPSRFRQPKRYEWSDDDREHFGRRHVRWSAAAADTMLAEIAQVPTASSLLLPLEVSHWLASPTDAWTPWRAMSHRRLAALAGVNKDSIAGGRDHLAALGLLEWRRAASGGGTGAPPAAEYRLAARLFPEKDGTFYPLPGSLVYGGVWARIPRPSARHLLLVIAALTPLADEESFRAMCERDHDDPARIERRLARIRSERPMPLSMLVERSGLSLTAVREALGILQAPISPGQRALIEASGETPRHYWIATPTLHSYWAPELLNATDSRTRLARAHRSTVRGLAA